jgi:hypothetical protein
LSPADFSNASGDTKADWSEVKELRLGDKETLKDSKKNLNVEMGGSWQGDKPSFRNLRWIQ